MAEVLLALEYSAKVIADTFKLVFNAAASVAAEALRLAGVLIEDVAKAIAEAFQVGADVLDDILGAAGFAADAIGDALDAIGDFLDDLF